MSDARAHKSSLSNARSVSSESSHTYLLLSHRPYTQCSQSTHHLTSFTSGYSYIRRNQTPSEALKGDNTFTLGEEQNSDLRSGDLTSYR